MVANPLDSEAAGVPSAAFATTHWSVVLRAGHEASDDTERALASLCQAYCYPLYAFVRRLGHSPHDAQDLTQSFFAYLIEKRLLARANPDAGRFRSFLLGSLKNFLANEWRRQGAEKRGAARTISLDAQEAEDRYAIEPTDETTPQMLYEQAWAVALMEQASTLLETEYARGGKQDLFRQLAPCLQGDRNDVTYLELGKRLGLSEGAVKVAVHRLRQRYRELLRAAIADTVADPLEIESELRHLVQVLSR